MKGLEEKLALTILRTYNNAVNVATTLYDALLELLLAAYWRLVGRCALEGRRSIGRPR